jgi:Tol biopolymer transport system component
MAKNMARRMRDIRDVVLELDGALADDGTASAETESPGRVWKVATLVAALIAAAAMALLWQRSESTTSGNIPLLPTIGLTRLTSDSGLSTQPSLSADGRFLAYASNRSGAANLDIYVQQTSGGTAIRLTDDPADDHQPSLSPDGSLVAFRSERTPRGIYVASALGGGARFLVPDGRGPAFSPDGQSIAFWTGRWLAPRGKDAYRQAFVVPAGGGTPTRVANNLASAGDLVWAPDGQSLLLFGWESATGETSEPDWWWLPAGSSTASPTGAFARFQAQAAKNPIDLNLPYPLSWFEGGVIFSGDRGSDVSDAQGLWSVAVDPGSGHVMSEAVRLTNGTTRDLSASVSRNSRIVFSAQNSLRTTLALTLDANAGKAIGPVRHLRQDTVETGRTSLSEDGRLMALPKYESEGGSLWVRDLQKETEWQLVATPRTPLNPVMSADGRWVAYTVTKVITGGDSGFGDVFIVQAEGGVPRKVCESCEAQNWTRDDREIVVADPDRRTLTRVDIASAGRIPLVAASSGALDRPLFGPNGRWVAFNGDRGTFVATVHADHATPEAEWIKLIGTSGGERSAGLSPDGRLLYLLLERDGFRCLYAMPVDAVTGHSNGEPFPVAHFHDATRQWGTTGYGSAVARGIFVVNLFETTGNLWMTTLTAMRR